MLVFRLPTVEEVESMILVRVNGVLKVRKEFPRDTVKEYAGGLNEAYYFIKRIWELLVQDVYSRDVAPLYVSEIMLSKELRELACTYARMIKNDIRLVSEADPRPTIPF